MNSVPESIQAAQVTQSQLALRGDERERLRIKLTYIVGGMIVGSAAAFLSNPKKPLKSVVIGAVAGEYLGWLLHGLKYNRWFL